MAAASGAKPLGAIVAFYAGFPTFTFPDLRGLPPLLEIHGGADRAVPLSDGARLVEAVRQAGGSAAQVVYPGQDHAFDLDLRNSEGAAARQQAVNFLRSHLL